MIENETGSLLNYREFKRYWEVYLFWFMMGGMFV